MQDLAFITSCVEKKEFQGTAPLYIYDRQLIIEQCRKFRALPYPELSIHYATMANAGKEFLEIIHSCGLGVFVNSMPHLARVESAGFREKEILFAASSQSTKILEKLASKGITVHLDSPAQLSFWKSHFWGKPVGIRCNPDMTNLPAHRNRAGTFTGEDARLGFLPEEIAAITDRSGINGLHLYPGTDILDADYLLEHYRNMINVAATFPELDYLDLGGGFGVDEENKQSFDFEYYGRELAKLMDGLSVKMGRRIRLILEPGRIIGADAGYFITRVNDVKRRQNNTIIVVNASIAQFPRPLFYPSEAKHPVHHFDGRGKINNQKSTAYSIVGCSTYSRDIFCENILLANVEPGDLLVFGKAGAYCAAMHTEFLGFEKPKEIFL